MPRSSTTLIERVLASYPRVAGVGEGPVIGALAADFQERIGDIHRPDPQASAVGRHYLSWLDLAAGGSDRVVDKTPDNLFHLGEIACLFPRARVIVCRRDPRDVCLSCHFQGFTLPMAYTTQLEDCAERWRIADGLVDHWRGVFGDRLFELRYEILAVEPEREVRRLLRFLELPWDDECLSFHARPGVVTSASVWQVRRPVHAGSVGRWRRYEAHLGPLLGIFGRGDRPRGRE